MAKRIVVTSQKGGVGKTTISLHLALALAEMGRPTLLVDLDPQGGIGHSLARGDTELIGLADRLMGDVTVEQAGTQLDPTNNTLTDERYIKIATGRDYDDAAPIRGSFNGPPGATTALEVTVEVEKI